MKQVKTKNEHKGTILVQLRLKAKGSKPLTPYTAWDVVEKAFENHPTVELYQAEFRIDNDELKTTIED